MDLLPENEWLMLGSSVALSEIAGIAAIAFAGPQVTGWAVNASGLGLEADWVFGPVLAGIYVLAGIALYLIWKRASRPGSARAMELFGLQLALGVIWSAAFFTLNMPAVALALAVLLVIVTLATMAEFWKLDARASVLLLPYLAWATFIGMMNYSLMAA